MTALPLTTKTISRQDFRSQQTFLVDLYKKVNKSQQDLLDLINSYLPSEEVVLVDYSAAELEGLLTPWIAQDESSSVANELPAAYEPVTVIDNFGLVFIDSKTDHYTCLLIRFDCPDTARSFFSTDLMQNLLPHLKQSLKLSLSIQKKGSDNKGVAYVLDQYPVPTAAVDDRQRVVFCNQALNQILQNLKNKNASGRILDSDNNSRHFSSQDISANGDIRDRTLSRLIRKSFEKKPDSTQFSIVSINDQQITLVIRCPSGTPGILQRTSAKRLAWIHLLMPEFSLSLVHRYRLKMQGFTSAETELVSLLFNGQTLKSIASLRQVSFETVRKQLASVFKKTECGSQEALMIYLFENFIQSSFS